jgi:hypothetical protein
MGVFSFLSALVNFVSCRKFEKLPLIVSARGPPEAPNGARPSTPGKARTSQLRESVFPQEVVMPPAHKVAIASNHFPCDSSDVAFLTSAQTIRQTIVSRQNDDSWFLRGQSRKIKKLWGIRCGAFVVGRSETGALFVEAMRAGIAE